MMLRPLIKLKFSFPLGERFLLRYVLLLEESGKMALWFGVDIGGSHVHIIGLNGENETIWSTRFPVSRDLEPDKGLESIKIEIEGLVEERRKHDDVFVAGIGVGCPGQSRDGVLVAASNLPKFKNVPVVETFEKMFPNSVCALLNDADAALSAEIWSPSTKHLYTGAKNIAMVTIGTGLGFSVLLNGEIFQGSNGLTEGGHMVIFSDPNAKRCGCGQVGPNLYFMQR